MDVDGAHSVPLVAIPPAARARQCVASLVQDCFKGAQDSGFGYVDYDLDKLPMVPTFECYLDRLERAGAKKGAMLDIGAATGFFLDIARRLEETYLEVTA